MRARMIFAGIGTLLALLSASPAQSAPLPPGTVNKGGISVQVQWRKTGSDHNYFNGGLTPFFLDGLRIERRASDKIKLPVIPVLGTE